MPLGCHALHAHYTPSVLCTLYAAHVPSASAIPHVSHPQVDPSLGGNTPLIAAIRTKNGYMVKELLRHAADVNLPDRSGLAPVHVAVSRLCYDMAEILVDHECNVNLRVKSDEKPLTPLMMAIECRNVPLTKLLLENKADPNLQDRWGRSVQCVRVCRIPLPDLGALALPPLHSPVPKFALSPQQRSYRMFFAPAGQLVPLPWRRYWSEER